MSNSRHLYLDDETNKLLEKLEEGNKKIASQLFKKAVREHFALTDDLGVLKKEINLDKQALHEISSRIKYKEDKIKEIIKSLKEKEKVAQKEKEKMALKEKEKSSQSFKDRVDRIFNRLIKEYQYPNKDALELAENYVKNESIYLSLDNFISSIKSKTKHLNTTTSSSS